MTQKIKHFYDKGSFYIHVNLSTIWKFILVILVTAANMNSTNGSSNNTVLPYSDPTEVWQSRLREVSGEGEGECGWGGGGKAENVNG